MTAPKVTPADLEAVIAYEYYIIGRQIAVNPPVLGHWTSAVEDVHKHIDCLTFCVLVLKNGFTVTGESACVSPENFDEAIGRRVAREHAVEKLWPLLGYQLKEQLHRDKTATSAGQGY